MTRVARLPSSVGTPLLALRRRRRRPEKLDTSLHRTVRRAQTRLAGTSLQLSDGLSESGRHLIRWQRGQPIPSPRPRRRPDRRVQQRPEHGGVRGPGPARHVAAAAEYRTGRVISGVQVTEQGASSSGQLRTALTEAGVPRAALPGTGGGGDGGGQGRSQTATRVEEFPDGVTQRGSVQTGTCRRRAGQSVATGAACRGPRPQTTI